MAKKRQDSNIIHFLLAAFLTLAIVLLMMGFLNQQSFYSRITEKVASPTPIIRIYHSKFLKITFSYPSKFNLEERLGTIFLKSDKGEIVIDRIGTNFKSIDEYLQDISYKNHLLIEEKKYIKVNDQDSVVAILKGSVDKDKSYFFYPYNWAIYTLSTRSQELFGDLDQIAHSFRYEP